MTIHIYASQPDFVERTSCALSDLQPRERTDTQSFIWVVAEYQGDREGRLRGNPQRVPQARCNDREDHAKVANTRHLPPVCCATGPLREAPAQAPPASAPLCGQTLGLFDLAAYAHAKAQPGHEQMEQSNDAKTYRQEGFQPICGPGIPRRGKGEGFQR